MKHPACVSLPKKLQRTVQLPGTISETSVRRAWCPSRQSLAQPQGIGPVPPLPQQAGIPGWLPHLFQKTTQGQTPRQAALKSPPLPAPAQHTPDSSAPLPGLLQTLCPAHLCSHQPQSHLLSPPLLGQLLTNAAFPDTTQGPRTPSGTKVQSRARTFPS